MKKFIPINALAALLFAGCTPSNKQNGSATASTSDSAVLAGNVQNAEARPLKIAFVEMDSVLNNYEQYKEMNAQLEKRSIAGRNQLQSKVNAIQKASQEFQQKLQSGGFVNQTAAEMEQNRIVKMQQDAQLLDQNLSEQYIKEQESLNEKLYNTIQQEVEKMNKEWGYDLILCNVKMSGLLYGKPEMDITKEVTKRLNDAYAASQKNTAKK